MFHEGDLAHAKRCASAMSKCGIPTSSQVCIVTNPSMKAEAEAIIHHYMRVNDRPTHIILCNDMFRGWPLGPNHAFDLGFQWGCAQDDPFIVIEPDCCPVRQGWLQLLDEEFKKSEKLFMGHIHEGATLPSGLQVVKHMTGAAIYSNHAGRVSPLLSQLGNYNQTYLSQGVQPSPWDVYARWEMLNNGADTRMIRSHWNAINFRLLPKGQYSWGHQTEDSAHFAEKENPGRIASISDVVLIHGVKDDSLHAYILDPGKWVRMQSATSGKRVIERKPMSHKSRQSAKIRNQRSREKKEAVEPKPKRTYKKPTVKKA